MWFESFINLPIVLWKRPYWTRTHGEKHQQTLWTDSSQEWRAPAYVLSDSTSQPCMGIMDGVTQLCWAWAVPVHNQPLPHTKSKSPVEVCIYIINNIYIIKVIYIYIIYILYYIILYYIYTLWFESSISLPIVLWKRPHETRTHGEKHQKQMDVQWCSLCLVAIGRISLRKSLP